MASLLTFVIGLNYKMAKEVFGEYSAYTTPRGIRFMKQARLISESAMPREVVIYLKQKLGDDTVKVQAPESPAPPPVTPRFPMPTPEQLAKMREESFKVSPELQMTPDEVAARSIPTEDNPNELPLTPEDFDITDDKQVETRTDLTPTQTGAAAGVIQELTQHVEEHSIDYHNGYAEGFESAQESPVPPVVHPDFLETVSIHTAALEDIAQALYERFGIYTVYLRELPQADEVNPLTGIQFTKYHLGIAYQAALYAQSHGTLNKDPEALRRSITAGRDASANVQSTFEPIAHTMGEARRANNFDYRTSVNGTQEQPTTRIEHVRGEDGELHAVQVPIPKGDRENKSSGAGQRFDAQQDEQIVEPPIFGTKPIIRPVW